MKRKRTPYGWIYQQERRRLLASAPPCAYGCGRAATEADHQPPLSLHFHAEGSGCCTLVPSCTECRRRQATVLSRVAAMPRAEVGPPDPVGFDVDDAVWDVPWLDELREVPDEAWWPRLMTVPHPEAVGSIGDELTEWVRVELGISLRWWQRLFATRLLEVDAEGQLVWTAALLTLARQCGKSLFVYCLCEWRSEQAERFGEPQLVLHTADTLEHAKAVWMQAVRRAQEKDWPTPRLAAGEYAVHKPSGKWYVRSQAAVVGYTASLAVADECHAIKTVTVDQGLSPTTIEAAQGQLLLVSTAHSQCSDLFPTRRAGALARLGDPDNELIVEWSAPRGASVSDVVARRQASPWWHRRRADEIRSQAERAAPYESLPYPHELVVGVRSQFHNEWRAVGLVSGRGGPLLDPEQWAGAASDVDSAGPLVIGVEDQTGHGAAVAFCGQAVDGRFVIGGRLCESRAVAYALARRAALSRPGSTLVVGASLAVDLEIVEIPVVTVRKSGAAETGASLTNLRDLLGTGRVVHDGSVDLDAQVASARVSELTGGLSLVAGSRSDLLRAAVWALRVASTSLVPAPAIH